MIKLSELLSGFIGAVIGALFTIGYEEYKRNESYYYKMYNELYNKFYIARNRIHKGRAYNFSDLSEEQRYQIIKILEENIQYSGVELNKIISDFIYQYNVEEYITDEMNKKYNTISEYIFTKKEELEKKIYNKDLLSEKKDKKFLLNLKKRDRENIFFK